MKITMNPEDAPKNAGIVTTKNEQQFTYFSNDGMQLLGIDWPSLKSTCFKKGRFTLLGDELEIEIVGENLSSLIASYGNREVLCIAPSLVKKDGLPFITDVIFKRAPAPNQ